MIQLWRKVRRNFEHYRDTLQRNPQAEIVHLAFQSPIGQLDLWLADRNAFQDILHAYLGIHVHRDTENFLKMGKNPKESEQLAWQYLEMYQHNGLFDFHFFLPVKVRHFQQKLQAHLTQFQSDMDLPIEGQIEHAISLVEHPHHTQMICQTDKVYAYFQFSAR